MSKRKTFAMIRLALISLIFLLSFDFANAQVVVCQNAAHVTVADSFCVAPKPVAATFCAAAPPPSGWGWVAWQHNNSGKGSVGVNLAYFQGAPATCSAGLFPDGATACMAQSVQWTYLGSGLITQCFTGTLWSDLGGGKCLYYTPAIAPYFAQGQIDISNGTSPCAPTYTICP